MPSIMREPPQLVLKCQRFRLAFADSRRYDTSAKRREAVADHIGGWLSGSIVAEHRCGSECLLTIEIARPVPVAAAERFARECPHYIRDTFAAVGASAVMRRIPN